MKGYSLAIVGSRTMTDWALFREGIAQCLENFGELPVKVVSGGAKGADRMARVWAKQNEIELVEFLPDWKGIVRNADIVKASDKVLAFPSKKGRGTQNTIARAQKQNKEVIVLWMD